MKCQNRAEVAQFKLYIPKIWLIVRNIDFISEDSDKKNSKLVNGTDHITAIYSMLSQLIIIGSILAYHAVI